jgi:Tol biopolymer transport system component
VDPSGRIVDLSRSPYQDFYPAVSSNGKRVAFFSDRSGAQRVYEVGIDGRGLSQIGGSLVGRPNGFAPLAWQPHGGRLAVSTDRGDWIVQPGRASVHLRRDYGISGWSPDGRMLAVSESDSGTKGGELIRVVTPLGRTLWTVRNVNQFGPSTGWSAHGLLAVPNGAAYARKHGLAVYDEAGHRRLDLRLGRLGRLAPEQAVTGTWFAWSPDGSRLAFVVGHVLQVRTTAGRVLLRKRLSDVWAYLLWNGNNRVVGYGVCGCRVKKVDLRTGKTSASSNRFALQTSADGGRAVLTAPSGTDFAIQVARTAGGAAKTYAHVPGCDQNGQWNADATSFQFVPRSRSLVFNSYCQPLADLYSVSAGGGTPNRITSSRSDHSAPALSPDGSEIAYSFDPCSPHGCVYSSSGIRVLSVDGSGEHVLTTNADCPPPTYGPFETPAIGDFTPAWSPGGKTILFSRRVCGGDPELFTVAASGGAVHDLGIGGGQPAWGPSRIAYIVGSFIWTANPDGSNPVKIDGGLSYSPAWSPDGRLTYLKGNKNNYRGYYGNTLVVSGKQTTLPFASVSSVAWSTDGSRLVVTAQQTTTAPFDVYSVNPDGSEPVRLTQNYGADGASWR